MQESLTLFNEMVNNKNFEDMPFIVFFNKRDLFEEKIKKKSIAVAFPNYQVSSGIYNRGWTGGLPACARLFWPGFLCKSYTQ